MAVCVCAFMGARARVCVWVRALVCVCAHARMHVCMPTCVCVCVYVCACVRGVHVWCVSRWLLHLLMRTESLVVGHLQEVLSRSHLSYCLYMSHCQTKT